MFNPLTQLNHFFRLATDRKLSGSDQLMYLHIFMKFNQAHWTETLRIKDAELKDLMRLYDSNGKPMSIEMIRRGRQRLKAKGFIEVLNQGEDGHEPNYRMPRLYPINPPDDPPADPPDDPPADPPDDPSERPYIRTREDVEDVENVKTKAKGDARESVWDVFKVWNSEMPRSLTASEKYELADFEESFGFEKVKEAIIATRRERYYPTFADFKKTLLKGGEKNERDNEPYTKPQYAENAPWQRF